MIIKGEGRFELHVKELQRNSCNGKILQNFQRTSFYQERVNKSLVAFYSIFYQKESRLSYDRKEDLKLHRHYR